MSKIPGPVLTERKVISNILRFTSTIYYKYRINYECDGISEEAKRAVLAETLGSAHTPFLIVGSYVYCTKAIQRNSISTFWKGIPIKLLFSCKKKYNITQDCQLLQILVERFVQLVQLKPVQFGDEKVVFDLIVLNKYRNGEDLLYIDFLFYVMKKKPWTDEKWQPGDSRKTRVYFKNQIYSLDSFSKEENFLILKSNSGEVVLAPPNLCFELDSVDKILCEPSNIMIPITNLLKCQELKVWNLNFNSNLTLTARILPPEKIIFGDGVECVHTTGNWISSVRRNEFFNPIELWSWCILYTEPDDLNAHLLFPRMQKLPEDTGVLIGKPLYLKINDDIYSYNEAINSIVSKNLQIVIVFVPNNTKNKPDRLIKYLCCVQNSIPFLILRSAELINAESVHDVLLKITSILGGTPWTVDISQFKDTMFCGSDYYSPKDATKLEVGSLVTNLSDDGSSWHSYFEIITNKNLSYLVVSMEDSIKKYCDINGQLPKQIVIYQRVEYHNHDVLRSFYSRNFNLSSYKNIKVIVLFVRTNSHVLFFRTANNVAFNVPPGSVIHDPLLTDGKDFYLVSTYSPTQVVRPTHYNVVHNKCNLSYTDLQIMTYKMCHLDYALPKICDIPAPLSYARKLAILISDFGVVPQSSDLNSLLYYL